MVIAIQREDDYILSPAADTIFREHDVVWFVSDEKSAQTIKQKEEI
jgi:K+/H+ antiporter YhaU regulatory subunit KhtT